jgi:hypothetical protein
VTRRVVITADDLGREEGTTAVIAALLADGHVSAATLIPVSPAAPRAAALARDLRVAPHLHITLTSERDLPPWRPLAGPSSLADRDGLLRDSAVAQRAGLADIRREMDAQLAWMIEHGLVPRAADSHAGVLYGLSGEDGAPAMLAEALLWCAGHRLAFRLPRDPMPWWGGPLPPPLASAHEQGVALADALGVPLPATIVTNRRGAAELGGYDALRENLIDALTGLPEGTSELFLHPSAEEAVAGLDGVVRAWEARLLRDPAWHAAIEAEGIGVVSRWWP